MSSSFVNRIRKVMNVFDDTQMSRQELYVKTGVMSTILLGHGIYAFSTCKKENITIEKKYKMNRNGFTEFMIIDNKGRHFNVNNSVWYWKWDSVEDWNNIKENKNLDIKYYGYRIPVFGMFPNVVFSKI